MGGRGRCVWIGAGGREEESTAKPLNRGGGRQHFFMSEHVVDIT